MHNQKSPPKSRGLNNCRIEDRIFFFFPHSQPTHPSSIKKAQDINFFATAQQIPYPGIPILFSFSYRNVSRTVSGKSAEPNRFAASTPPFLKFAVGRQLQIGEGAIMKRTVG